MIQSKPNESADLIFDDEDMMLPPRSVLHPNSTAKLVRLFYRSLVVLFVLLTVGLAVWGLKLSA